MAADELRARAEALHRAHPVVECHSDMLVDVYRRRRAGEASPLCCDWLERLRAGGVRISFVAAGGDVPEAHDPDGQPNLRALQMLDDARVEAHACEGLRIVETGEDLDRVLEEQEVGLLLHLEGLRPLLGRPAMVRHFHRLGLRSVQLTWNGANEAADGVGVASPGPLTPLGRELVAELDRHGILLDVSHLSEPSFWDLLGLAGGPLVASHANAHALCPHPRNLRDDQIRALAERGGYVGICFLPDFLGEDASLERVLDHVDHVAGLVGTDHVAVGPDYTEYMLDLVSRADARGIVYEADRPFAEGLQRIETLPAFTAGLLARGYAEEDVARIVGGNAVRVLRTLLPPD